MKLVIASIALLSTVLAMPAYARHCPVDMKKIDAALVAGTNLSEDKLVEVKKLRAEGERLHNAGKHGKAVKTLGKAKKLLKIKKSGYSY